MRIYIHILTYTYTVVLGRLGAIVARPSEIRRRAVVLLGSLFGIILEPFWWLVGPSWGSIGALLEVFRAFLGPCWRQSKKMRVAPISVPPRCPTYRLLEPSWDALGALLGPSWSPTGQSWGVLGPSWAFLGPSLGSSWGHLGAYWGRLEAVLGPLWYRRGPSLAVLGCVGRLDFSK